MATDATGTPTALGIPKFNTSVDAPSGLGSNAQMDSIDGLLQANTGFQTSGIVIKGNKLLSGDANLAFALYGDGTQKWGAGGASALDTTLNRTGAGVLRLTGTFNATVGYQLNGTALAASHLSNGVTGSGAVVLAASPTLTGSPIAPTQALNDNSTKIATTAYVDRIITGAVTSVFTRSGAVTAQSGDYTAAQVTNAADKSSGSVQTFTAELRAPDFYGNIDASTVGSGGSWSPDITAAQVHHMTWNAGPTAPTLNNPSGLSSSYGAFFIFWFTNSAASGSLDMSAHVGTAYKAMPSVSVANGQQCVYVFYMIDSTHLVHVGNSGAF